MHSEKSPAPVASTPDPLSEVAVVTVSFRSAAHLQRLLPTLPVDRLAAVVVVDNASDDGSAAVAASYAGVTAVANTRNVGFGAACNIGAERAPDTAFLLFLNPDATIDPADLARLVQALHDDPSCGLIAPRLFRDGQPLTSSGEEATVRSELRRFAPRLLARRLPDRRHSPDEPRSGPVVYVEGACMLVRRSAFAAVGGFDPSFFLFYEELDLAHRLRAAGWTVRAEPAARAEHAVAASRGSLPDNARATLVDGTVRYLGKWHGHGRARAYVMLARPLWRLREWRGQLSANERRAYVAAARSVLDELSRSRSSGGGPSQPHR